MDRLPSKVARAPASIRPSAFVLIRKAICSRRCFFASVKDVVHLFSYCKRDRDAVLLDDAFYCDLYRGCWAATLPATALKGVAMRRAWKFCAQDGHYKRRFITSHLADLAQGKENYPMTVQLTFLTNIRFQADDQTRLKVIGSTGTRMNFGYQTRLTSGAGAVFGPRSQAAKKMQIYRAGAMIGEAGGKGFGLRTLEHIKAGEFVCEYVGEYQRRRGFGDPGDPNTQGKYAVRVRLDADNGHDYSGVRVAYAPQDEAHALIDGRHFGNAARFLNHSFTPNLVMTVEPFDEHVRAKFYACADIGAGDELTWDYTNKSNSLGAGRKPAPEDLRVLDRKALYHDPDESYADDRGPYADGAIIGSAPHTEFMVVCNGPEAGRARLFAWHISLVPVPVAHQRSLNDPCNITHDALRLVREDDLDMVNLCYGNGMCEVGLGSTKVIDAWCQSASVLEAFVLQQVSPWSDPNADQPAHSAEGAAGAGAGAAVCGTQ